MNISAEKLVVVERMLAEGELSQREIARVAGVSRSTALAVAVGRLSSAARRAAIAAKSLKSSNTLGVCPRCHSTVYLPCYACALRDHLAGGPAPTVLPPADKHPRDFTGRERVDVTGD